jgi:hypothetical protein
MRKIIKYIVLTVCILIYVVSCNQILTNEFNNSKVKFIPAFESDRWKYGDLYGMSYLSYFRKNYHDINNIKRISCSDTKDIDLYSICDSYLWAFFPSRNYYCGVNKFVLAKTNTKEKLKINLDSTKINILLIEFSERNLRDILLDAQYINNLIIIKPQNIKSNINRAELLENHLSQEKVKNPSYLFDFHSFLKGFKSAKSNFFDFIFNNKINSNIKSNIWDISLFTSIKELKANMNYKLFKSIDKDVSISKDEKQLFYSPTIDTTESTSSFKSLTTGEIDTLINRLNTIYFNAKHLGFEEVYLSMIPNPVSVIEPDYKGLTYNHLVERIQSSAKLKIPFVDVFTNFKHMKKAVYSTSDTHWNMTGANIWLNKVNDELNKISKFKKTSKR